MKKTTTKPQKRKTPHNSTRKKEVDKIVACTFYDMKDMKEKPIPMSTLRNRAIEAVKILEANPEIYTLRKVWNTMGILRQQWKVWMDRCIDVKMAHEYMRQIIADRREEGALNGKIKEHTANAYLPMYCDDIQEMMKWRESIKNPEVAQSNEKYVIQMYQFPEEEEK